MIQSISEFLPISSSAHLAIFSWITGEQIPMTHKIALHMGSFLALFVYYRWFIWRCLQELWQKGFQSLAIKLFVLCLPAVIAGACLNQYAALWGTPKVIGAAAMMGGLLLILADRSPNTRYLSRFQNVELVDFSYRQAFVIGLFQVFAIIPGMSRMGMIVTGARFMGMDRLSTMHLAFITAMPMILGALVLNWKDISITPSVLGVWGLSLITLQVMLWCLPRITYFWFGIYRIILGCVLLIVI